jgi:hypothetical protein
VVRGSLAFAIVIRLPNNVFDLTKIGDEIEKKEIISNFEKSQFFFPFPIN